MTYDPLKLSSGLLDDDRVVFRDAIFRTDPEYRDGQVLFLDATLLKVGDGEETNQYFGCGNNWETDDGSVATHETKPDSNFNKNARIGELFKGLVNVMANDAKADAAVRDRIKKFPLGPREAGFWKGLDCHITAVDRKGSGEVDDYSVLVIDEFYGFEGDEAKPAAGATKKASAKKAAGATKKAAPKAAEAPGGGMTDEIRARLDVIADESDDHESFMERAFAEVPEASSIEEVRAAVADGEEGSIWGDAVARFQAQG